MILASGKLEGEEKGPSVSVEAASADGAILSSTAQTHYIDKCLK